MKAPQPPTGEAWLHEIKHDGFRVVARKDGNRVRLYSRPGNDLTYRFPLIVESLARLRSRSCIIDGEANQRNIKRAGGDPEAGKKRCTSLRYRHLSNAKGQKSKSSILLARGGSGSPSLGTPDRARPTQCSVSMSLQRMSARNGPTVLSCASSSSSMPSVSVLQAAGSLLGYVFQERDPENRVMSLVRPQPTEPGVA